MKRPWESLLRSYPSSAQYMSARLNPNYAVFWAGINQHHTKSIVFMGLQGAARHEDEFRRIHTSVHVLRHASEPPGPANLWSWMTSRDHQVSLDSCIAVHYCYRPLIASWGRWGEGICRPRTGLLYMNEPWTESDHFSKRAARRLETQ